MSGRREHSRATFDVWVSTSGAVRCEFGQWIHPLAFRVVGRPGGPIGRTAAAPRGVIRWS